MRCETDNFKTIKNGRKNFLKRNYDILHNHTLRFYALMIFIKVELISNIASALMASNKKFIIILKRCF